jgi:hypothetical protein
MKRFSSDVGLESEVANRKQYLDCTWQMVLIKTIKWRYDYGNPEKYCPETV